MNNPDLFNEAHRATYCPEDDKLRLYVGRVPRPEYDALRAEGWTSTPKQDCDFAAVWTPARYQTALSYAGIVEDEDMGPDERAADRAERFTGYLERRSGEAIGYADHYDGESQYHGYQDSAKAERAAARHDRQGARAVDAWSKAEYWQRRTAGVIGHALYVSSPGVRMGRIKTLEAELRKREKDQADWIATWTRNAEIVANPEPLISHLMQRFGKTRQTAEKDVIEEVLGSCYKMQHPRVESSGRLYIFELLKHSDPLTMAEFFAHWTSLHPTKPEEESPWIQHLKLRLAYERQMLEAQGGRAASLEMETGGTFHGRLIWKVNKSPVTGRVTSVSVLGPKIERWTYKAANIPGTEYAEHQFETERAEPGAYQEPTEETRAKLAAIKAEMQAAKPKKDACPLINPTKEDAERLMSLWNDAAREKHAQAIKQGRTYGSFEAGKVGYMSQATYSRFSAGTYGNASTRGLKAGGELVGRRDGPEGAVCKLRIAEAGGWWTPPTIIILEDKPQKPLPASVWAAEPVTA